MDRHRNPKPCSEGCHLQSHLIRTIERCAKPYSNFLLEAKFEKAYGSLRFPSICLRNDFVVVSACANAGLAWKLGGGMASNLQKIRVLLGLYGNNGKENGN